MKYITVAQLQCMMKWIEISVKSIWGQSDAT